MKLLKGMGKVFGITLAVLMVLLMVLNIGVSLVYRDFFGAAAPQFRTPGLTTGFVPQGFDFVEDKDCYLVSGYMKDHTASRIYIRYTDGNVHCVALENADGTAYTEHAGGIAVNGDYVYLPGRGGVDVFLLSDLLANHRARSVGKIAMAYDGDCCTFYNGYLLVGDFYYPGTYETPADHRVTTPAGDQNPAVIAIYQVDPNAAFGVDPVPIAAISVRDRVQGFDFTEDGKIVLSTSYGLKSSQLWFYTFDDQRCGSVQLDGKDVPLYYLDSENLTKTVQMPPMSEEVVCKDGKVFVVFESACTKYLFGNFIRGTYVYAYAL